jgi:cellulose synthase operon protein C
MKWRRWTMAALALLVAAGAVHAEERYLDFIKALRERDYHDYAIIYLEQIEQRPGLPPEIREVIPYEKAITYLEGARMQRSPEAQGKQLDLAKQYLEAFLKASPKHEHAAQANSELAQVLVGKGRVEVLQSRSPNNAGQKSQFQKAARDYFAQARKVFQTANDQYKAEYDKFPKFIQKTDKAQYDARETAMVNLMQAQLNLAILTYEEAQSYEKSAAEYRKRLIDASNEFEKIHAQYRSQLAGLYARMWQGKCFEEQNDITKALGIYGELLEHGKQGGEKPSPALKSLQDKVLQFRLICLNHEQRKDHQVALQESNDWMKENRTMLSSRIGLGIQWEKVRALEALGDKEGASETEKRRHYQEALNTAQAINRYPGEFRDVSTAMIQRLMVKLDRDATDPRDFATAYGVARNLMDRIKRINGQLEGARGAERNKLIAELNGELKESARILNIALQLAGPKDDIKDVNRARYFLSYALYRMGDRSYDAAILCEFVARRYLETDPDLAQDAAYLGQAAYIQAYHRAPSGQRDVDVERIISVCNFITGNWPASDKANDARMNLGALYTHMRRPAEAAKWYMQVPETSERYLNAQLDAGKAYWQTYLQEVIRPEEERPAKEELDGLQSRALQILRDAIAKSEAKLSKDAGPDDNISGAKLSLAEILNGSGDYQGALAVLTEGARSLQLAVAAPNNDEKQRPPSPAVKSKLFASLVYQTMLRSYVGIQDLDKARAAMKELEKIEGAGGGGASVTRIYLELGKELEKEVKRLQAAKDPRLGEVLKSFETFLDDMSKRKEGQDYNTLIWIAETYKALGEGLDEGDTGKAIPYFAKAAASLQAMLDEDAKKPGFIPEGSVPGVKLRLVTCKRRQKSFDEAHKLIAEILSKRNSALDAQQEAAQLYQDWAARGGPDDLDKWRLAIEGDEPQKTAAGGRGGKVIWGWLEIADRLESNLTHSFQPNPEYEKQYVAVRYNVAYARFKYAMAQSSEARKKPLLSRAYADVLITGSLTPDMGGDDYWPKFNELFRSIQQEMVDLGMDEMKGKQVADLERRERPTLQERSKAVADARQASQNDAAKAASTAAGTKPAAKAAAKAEANPKPEGGSTGIIMFVLLLLVGTGGMVGYTVWSKKKQQPRPSYVDLEDESLPFPPKKSPPARTKA